MFSSVIILIVLLWVLLLSNQIIIGIYINLLVKQIIISLSSDEQLF